MEDLFQEADKALAIVREKFEASQTAEKAASFKVVQLTEKFESVQKSETTLKTEKAKLSEETKSAKSAASQAKKELSVQVEKYTKDTAKLQKDLATVQANEQVLIKSNRQLVEEKANLSKQIVAKNPDAPVPEKAGVLIRHIFFGPVRITSPAVYQKVLDSYAEKDAPAFTVDSKFVEGADPHHQSTFFHTRHLTIYYAVRKGNALIDHMDLVEL